MNSNPWREIGRKALFTVIILIVYRFGTYIPIPLIDTETIAEFSKVAKSGVFGMFNMFSGGSISRVSMFALGIMPYITASIVMQLITATTPSLKKMKQEEGEAGQRAIGQYTKYLTLLIGLFQGYMLASGFVAMQLYSGNEIMFFRILSAIVMTTGTLSLIWLGDQCTQSGLGNGSSIIIFAGIVAEAPRDFITTLSMSKTGSISTLALLMLFVIFVSTILFVVLIERSNRLIYIEYPRQSRGTSQKTDLPNFLPLKVNTAGVIPPIFASAILLLPTTITSVLSQKSGWIGKVASHFAHGQPVFIVCYLTLIAFFTFFYNNVIFDANEISDNLKRSGVFVPGYRPGLATTKLIQNILKKLSFIGTGYLMIVCLMPELLSQTFGYSILIGGTGALIIVGVIMDITANIQATLLYGKYGDIMQKKSF